MSEVYVSADVETDGPIPGPHSMLSFASAAYQADKTLLGTFSATLETLQGDAGYPATMDWWRQQPEAWAAAQRIHKIRLLSCPAMSIGSRRCRAARSSSLIPPVSISCSSTGTWSAFAGESPSLLLCSRHQDLRDGLAPV